MKYLSMFSGIGTAEKGIEQAYEQLQNDTSTGGLGQEEGISIRRVSDLSSESNERQYPTCIGFSEIDKYASSIYKYHWPDVANYGDATAIVCDDLPDFDFLVGGFPCQAFSIAGKRGGFDDVRGTLFFDIVRILAGKRPMYALLENVKGLVSHDNGRTLEIILEKLQEIGYYVNWEIYNSKDYGVPQNRERVFFICYNSDLLRDGHLTMTKPCVEIIKQWAFQTLLQNWGAAINRQGIESKDWVLGLSVLKETLSAIGQMASSNYLHTSAFACQRDSPSSPSRQQGR